MIVRLLLANDAAVNLAIDDGVTPLYIGCQEGHLDIVRLLLANDAAVNQAANNGFAPLSIGCQEGHLDIVRLLLLKAESNGRRTGS